MRVWLVPFEELDRQRLFAQHHEIHPLLQLVKTGRKWLGWEKPEHRDAIFDVHDRAVAEALRRGFPFNHVTPMDDALRANVPQVAYPAPPELVARDRWILVCRWEGVYRGTGYADVADIYGPLLDRWQREGCAHDAGWEVIAPDTEMCVICKHEFRQRVA